MYLHISKNFGQIFGLKVWRSTYTQVTKINFLASWWPMHGSLQKLRHILYAGQ